MSDQFTIDTLKHDVFNWVDNWVSVYNPRLNAVPCPYAKQAIVDKKIVWNYCKDSNEIRNCLKILATEQFADGKEVLVIGISPLHISAKELQDLITIANTTYLREAGMIALEDHPDAVEEINDERMNQGKWALVLVQASSKLDKASAILEKQGYYDSWSKDNIDDVVSWRKLI